MGNRSSGHAPQHGHVLIRKPVCRMDPARAAVPRALPISPSEVALSADDSQPPGEVSERGVCATEAMWRPPVGSPFSTPSPARAQAVPRGPSQGTQQGALSPLCCLGGGAREELGLTSRL